MTTVPIPLSGSLQNPAWSPDGKSLSLTRFIGRYNGDRGSEVYTTTLDGAIGLVADAAVSQPGSCWHANAGIIMSRTVGSGHDEIWRWRADGGGFSLQQLTKRAGFMAYEPTWDIAGYNFAFESHVVDQEDRGRIVIGSTGHETLFFVTPEGSDCRQPNWSPDGKWIVYQENINGRWMLRLYDVGSEHHGVSIPLDGDATDATFSPDSEHLIYSGEWQDMDGCLLSVPVAGGPAVYVAGARGEYHGAPSWGPNGLIACEWGLGDPDASGKPTKIVLVKAPA